MLDEVYPNQLVGGGILARLSLHPPVPMAMVLRNPVFVGCNPGVHLSILPSDMCEVQLEGCKP